LHEDIEVNVKVTSYAPQVFKFIRAIDKINEIEIMKSVKPELNRMQIFKQTLTRATAMEAKVEAFSSSPKISDTSSRR